MFGEGLKDPERKKPIKINHFNAARITLNDIALKSLNKTIKVIKAIDKELITNTKIVEAKVENGLYVSDIGNDVLKIIVHNRYEKAKPSIAFITNFGLKRGAIAGSIAHDSHNIIAVGTNDLDIVQAVNKVIDDRGGIVCSCGDDIIDLPLEIGGLMSSAEATIVAKKYEELDHRAKEYGSLLTAPFMTLSFMALLVIPELKISDKGLFDGLKFKFTTLDVK
jgi:adenine deaminase